MGLFDFFKSKKDDNNTDKNELVQKSQSDEDRFEKEIYSFLPRYLSASSVKINLSEFQPLSKTFAQQFEEWRTIHSLADRRGIIYTIFDKLIGTGLTLWQAMERCVDDRRAEHAKNLGDFKHT